MRLGISLFLGGLGAFLALDACSFPSILFAEGDAASELDGAVPGPADGSADAESPPEILIDGASPDGMVATDAGTPIDASGCTSCDCDEDGFNDLGKAGCADAGGLNDCDDSDPRAKPGQLYLEHSPQPPMNGDWNCEKGAERLYPNGFSCGALLGIGCPTNTWGFSDHPGCGQVGRLVRCKGGPLVGCTEDSERAMQVKQACR